MKPEKIIEEQQVYWLCGLCLSASHTMSDAMRCCSQMVAKDDDYSTGRQPQKAPKAKSAIPYHALQGDRDK